MAHLRVLSWNLWHALNPYGRALMLPLEKPLEHVRRRNRQTELLSQWCTDPADVICLQELNPLLERVKHIRSLLSLEGEGAVANTGVKLGRFGLPPMLQEGPAIFVADAFESIRFQEKTLSGLAWEATGPFKIPVTVQLEERRKAVLFEGILEGQRVAVVNVHLHAGPDAMYRNLERRRSELRTLKTWVANRVPNWDLLVVCGDFNCDADSPAMTPLLELGLRDIAEMAGQKPAPTWEPDENALTAISSGRAKTSEEREWDATPHVFDRIYAWSREPLECVAYSQIRESELSDHYAVSAEIRFA